MNKANKIYAVKGYYKSGLEFTFQFGNVEEAKGFCKTLQYAQNVDTSKGFTIQKGE